MIERGRILLVDDEASVRLTLGTMLQRAGHDIMVAEDGDQAIALLEQQAFDLMIVDLCMPGMDGIQIAAAARERQPDLAVIVLTGHGTLESALAALHLQVFDYMLKTADPRDVVAQVNAGLVQRAQMLRQRMLLDVVVSAADSLRHDDTDRATPEPFEHQTLTVGAFHLDGWRQTVLLDGRAVALTPTEFRVLRCLAEHAGTLLPYTQLVQCAQGYEASEQEASEIIKPHIHHLRQKLEPNPAEPQYILNVRGKGYLLVPTGG